MPAIPPLLAPVRIEREPIRPQPPTDLKGVDRAAQTFQGAVFSAPYPAGVSFEGVGTGIPGFVPTSNPPDTNGRVGAIQYVQWNNTSFAIWDKSGTRLYGPVAGNTLFQPLGGACATHNDGDPVVAYDILSGRWILSQFVVGASPAFSHQCIAVSAYLASATHRDNARQCGRFRVECMLAVRSSAALSQSSIGRRFLRSDLAVQGCVTKEMPWASRRSVWIRPCWKI